MYGFIFLAALAAVGGAVPLSDTSRVVYVHYPEETLQKHGGSSIFLRGDGCGLNWDSGVEAKSDGKDRWRVDLDCSQQKHNSNSTATLSFKALVDDKIWQIGANSAANMKEIHTYPWFFTMEGSIAYIRDVKSDTLGNTRDLVLYLPPSYFENTLKVVRNVLVMHDGQNLFDRSTAFMGNAWMCQDTLNQMIVAGDMDEIAIIGVNNTPDRMDELTYSLDPTEKGGGKGDLYLDFIERVVLPLAASRFRLDVSLRSNVGMLGSSLGGLISCYAGWTRPNVYSRVGCMSSSFWWNSQDFNSTIIPKKTPPQDITIYLDSGDSGDSQDDMTQTLLVRSDMEARGFVLGSNLFYFLDKGGEHNEHYWGQRFHVPMKDLYPPTPL